MAFILPCSNCYCRASLYSVLGLTSFRCTWFPGKQRRFFFARHCGLKLSWYGWFVVEKSPLRTAKSSFLAHLEDGNEEHKSDEGNKAESEEDSGDANNYDNLTSEDKATLEEIDQLAEEWIGQDLSRWYTYRKFQALRNKLLKQEEEEELDTQREYEELYANLLVFGKMIGFPLVNEETGKINLYGYLVMVFFLLLPLVVLWYLGQAISSGVDWIIEHQSPF